MPRKAGNFKKSDFQNWLESALDSKGMSLAELARMVGSDYSHLWKILRGDPAKYPTSQRPGYDLTKAIGDALLDTSGALVSAGYSQDAPGMSPMISDAEAREILSDLQSLGDEDREAVKAILKRFLAASVARSLPEAPEGMRD